MGKKGEEEEKDPWKAPIGLQGPLESQRFF